MAKRLLKRDVMALHDSWAMDCSRWGENNLATVRSAIAYREARAQWEAENGKDLFSRPARRR